MRVHLLIIHPETATGGAERMLEYFLPVVSAHNVLATVAIADCGLSHQIPDSVQSMIIPDHTRSSLLNLVRQCRRLCGSHGDRPFDIVHGWAARDWELASAVARIWGKPALGTLHDHPEAYYIRQRRRWLMRQAAAWGLQRVVCVSEALRRACLEAKYARHRLATIHNGLPEMKLLSSRSAHASRLRLGYLGGLTPGKGIEDLLEITGLFAEQTAVDWTLQIAGAPVAKSDEPWLEQLKGRYASRPWWSRVVWLGWVKQPTDFLNSIDLLAFTSSSFDSLPTVLLEAARAGIPVLASAVGGAPEIVVHGLTGWLFTPGNRTQASRILMQLMTNRHLLAQAGIAARRHVAEKFSMQKMVESYVDLYLTLVNNG